MAMPSLLKRISRSVLQSPSVFRLEPVPGIPPAMASRIMGIQSPPAMASRFMGTQSQGEQRVCETFDAAQMTARLRESIKVMHQEAVNDQQMLRTQIAEANQDTRVASRSNKIELKFKISRGRGPAPTPSPRSISLPLTQNHHRRQQLSFRRRRPHPLPHSTPPPPADGSGCLRPRIHSTPAIPHQQTLVAAAAAAAALAVGSRAIETAGNLPRRGRGVYIATTTRIPGQEEDEEAPIRSGAEEGDIEEPLVSRRAETMADQLGSYTIRSHGMILARLHMYDWIILLLLAVIDGLLNIIEPFHRFVGKDMMTDLRYPMKGNTVPFWAVPLIGIILPWAIFVGIYFKQKNFYDLHHGILGILYSVLITAVITDAIKDGVGRPRPDFFWRCFPDGNDVYDTNTTGVICHGVKSVIKEGHKSFPSGHSSWSFAGLGFLAWYLAGKIAAFDRKGHIAKLCIVFLPLLTAALVAVSRVDDYWHHWQDVFAGGLIGLTVASFCYLQFFPYPFDGDAWWPHAYTVQVAEERNSRNANSYSRRPTEIETVNIPGRGGMTLRDTLNDLESGSDRRL